MHDQPNLKYRVSHYNNTCNNAINNQWSLYREYDQLSKYNKQINFMKSDQLRIYNLWEHT
jgi:hypothetical protein